MLGGLLAFGALNAFGGGHYGLAGHHGGAPPRVVSVPASPQADLDSETLCSPWGRSTFAALLISAATVDNLRENGMSGGWWT